MHAMLAEKSRAAKSGGCSFSLISLFCAVPRSSLTGRSREEGNVDVFPSAGDCGQSSWAFTPEYLSKNYFQGHSSLALLVGVFFQATFAYIRPQTNGAK